MLLVYEMERKGDAWMMGVAETAGEVSVAVVVGPFLAFRPSFGYLDLRFWQGCEKAP